MEGYLYMEDRGESNHGQRWGTPVTPADRKLPVPVKREAVVPRSLIALDKAALGVSEDWRERIALRCAKRKESSVRVVARFRPPSKQELQAEGGDESVFKVRAGGYVDAVEGTQCWEFDVAFGEDGSQQAVYNAAGRPVIEGLLDGYNGTIFAYGQTGSGKTYCMFGPSHELTFQASDCRGIVPRSVQHVFNHIRDGTDGTEFVLRCSLFEVYREQLRDLLDPANPNLRIKETPRQGVFVDGLAQEFVACEDDVVRLLRAGSRLRAVAATRLNQHSSRSHVIFSLACEQRLVDGTEKLAKLNLVDLAGSEKVWKSSSSGVTLEEAKKINLSLSALGNVISALASRRGHVPYRNSKLTRILQETLGGNFKTTLVVACSPLRMHLDETMSTLHFATRAKAVCNHVKVNFVYSAEQLMALVEQLQQELLTTRREVAKHGPQALPLKATMLGDAEAPDAQQHYHWDASLLDATRGPSPTPKKPKKHARLAALVAEVKPVFMETLRAQEELIGEYKAVQGAGLAHELRTSASAAGLVHELRTSASERQYGQTVTWETLFLQQCIYHKVLQMQCLSKQLVSQLRGRRALDARQQVLASHSKLVTSLQAQVAADTQSARDTFIEPRPSPTSSPSRAYSPRDRRNSVGSEVSVTLRDKRNSIGSEVSVILRAGPCASGAGAHPEAAAQSSCIPEVAQHNRCEVSRVQSTAGDVAGEQTEDVPSPAGSESEASRLRQELKMLEVDFERQKKMRHLMVLQMERDQQQWCEWATNKFVDLEQNEQQTSLEEQRLRELLERRQADISSARTRLGQRLTKILLKQHEHCITGHNHKLQLSDLPDDTAMQMATDVSRRKYVDDTIARIKEKRSALREEIIQGNSWPAALGA